MAVFIRIAEGVHIYLEACGIGEQSLKGGNGESLRELLKGIRALSCRGETAVERENGGRGNAPEGSGVRADVFPESARLANAGGGGGTETPPHQRSI